MKKLSENKHIILSISALFLILLVAAGITFSWIEGGSSFVIKSDDTNHTLKTGKLKDNNHYDGLLLDPDANATLDLLKFDKNTGDAQDLIFAQTYSYDGENFYFPADENDHNPRIATTNDKGTKFINFSFKSKAKKACYLAFDNENPLTITATKDGETIDTSAFRVMIKCGDDKKILTTSSQPQSSTYDGNTLTAEPASNYIYKNGKDTNALFEYTKNQEKNIEVSIWLDAQNAPAELLGGHAEIEMQIKVAVRTFDITFDAVTYTNAGEATVSSFTGGDITVDGSEQLATYTKSYEPATSFTAVANPATNYDFGGWYKNDSTCDLASRVSEATEISYAVIDNATYYAKFVEKPKYDISVVAKAKDTSGATLSNGGGTVYVNSSDTTTYSAYRDSEVTIVADPANGYRFDGWYTDDACTTNIGDSYRNATLQVKVSDTTTYYAKFVKQFTVMLKSVTDGEISGTGGEGNIDADNKGANISKTVDVGTSVSLSGSPNTGYEYKGIYATATGGTEITAPVIITVNTDVTYYARFEELPKYTITLKSVTDGEISGTGGDSQIDSDTPGASVQKTVYKNTTVILSGTANTGYDFNGIYESATDGSAITSTTVNVTADKTYYARFTKKSQLTTTIYFEQRNGYSSYNVWAYNSADNSKKYSGDKWPGNPASYDSNTGYFVFTFTTEDTGGDPGKFKVIVSNNGSPQYPASGGLEGTIGGTYFFESGTPSVLKEYNPVTVTLKAVTNGTVSGTGGNVSINGGTSDATASLTVQKGRPVTLNGTAKSGYEFDGIYTAATGGSKVTSPVTPTTSTTYYARFTTESTDRTIYLKPNSNWLQSNARFAVYVWDSSGDMWYDMTSDGNEYYKVTIPKKYSNIIFARMNPSTTDNNFNNGFCWHQTDDQKIQTDGKNCFKINDGSWDRGTWTTY